MSFKSYTDFLYQFDSTAIKDIQSPTGQLSIEVYADVTSYDNISDYLEPTVNIIDNSYITYSFQQTDKSKWLYKPTSTTNAYVDTLEDVYTLAGLDNVPSLFTMSLPISSLDNTAVFSLPFKSGNFVSAEIVNLDMTQKLYSWYSSYNNSLIYPNFPITNYSSLLKFSNQITQVLKTDSTIDFDLLTNTPSGCPTININLKYGVIFDNSLIGLPQSNQFQYDPSVQRRPKCTNITQNVIDSNYEYETEFKLNGQILLDNNITDITNPLSFDSTMIIENESYYINRQHVPPPRYLTKQDTVVWGINAFCPIINFSTYYNVPHVKINQHNHTCSRYHNNIMGSIRQPNVNESEFLIEFSGYNEVIEL